VSATTVCSCFSDGRVQNKGFRFRKFQTTQTANSV
jgi:hypothetical protein